MNRNEGEVRALWVRSTRTLGLGQMRARCHSLECWLLLLRMHVEEKRDADFDNTKSAFSKEKLRVKWGPEALASSH